MNLKNKKWLLLSIIAILVIIVALFYSLLESPVPVPLWRHRPIGPCRNMMPNYMLGVFAMLLILAIIPISHYLMTKKLEKQLEKNIKIISKFVNKKVVYKKHQKSKKEKTRNNIILKFLNPNERKIIEQLIEKKGAILQSEIGRMDGMTKLKTHRAVKDLEGKGIIKTESYGKTNKLKLVDDIKEVLVD